MSIFRLKGNEKQNAHVDAALAACDYPWNRLVPKLSQQQGRAWIPVEWENTDRYAGVAAASDGHEDHDHDHEGWGHVHIEGAHGIKFRRRILGLAWYSGKVTLDTVALTDDRPLAMEVFLAEGAHMVDFFAMTDTQREAIYVAFHGGNVPENHQHDWFGDSGYWDQVGEAFMGGFIAAYAASVQITMTRFTHATTPEVGRQIRKVLTPDIDTAPEEPEKPEEPDYPPSYYFGVNRSKVFHDAHREINHDVTWATYAEAEQAGRRPCRVCKPQPGKAQ